MKRKISDDHAEGNIMGELSLQRSEIEKKKRKKKKKQEESKDDIVDRDEMDEFQQATKPTFIDKYRVDLGHGADVFYQPNFIDRDVAQEWYDSLLELDTWYQPMLKLYGRTFPQSRQIAAYSIYPNTSLSYSGTNITMHHPFPPILETMRQRLEQELGVKFNHYNLNNLVIASISLGVERTFVMSPRIPSRRKGVIEEDEGLLGGRKSMKWKLGNGSLVIMQARTQEFWKVTVPQIWSRDT
ncbi:hypothetical protein TREMEDRAFT_61326 [Tremella mesenterica DSM 1558]|uniref:uncharacterized protein n=1 Tax=Tremella mesenterica (strain ATCC 24925 / CBS 8224 / DSM 1558 / NBRC 9311 / NRRL Y-6157 / RJB 2259-6 / UBC 559-6) TaxID=578456 RepID=UPI0003F4A42D|nr:uncharacterized protein TREMEDRAFT_61326 [Tremella mesenterica DSM 1558]EIW70818.1 hypothetical protein TREMEDRAFT_61326 [Tremella mesenterica DSM 1558]